MSHSPIPSGVLLTIVWLMRAIGLEGHMADTLVYMDKLFHSDPMRTNYYRDLSE